MLEFVCSACRCWYACAAAYFFKPSKKEKAGFDSPAGGGGGGTIIGMFKSFFTAGLFITESLIARNLEIRCQLKLVVLSSLSPFKLTENYYGWKTPS